MIKKLLKNTDFSCFVSKIDFKKTYEKKEFKEENETQPSDSHQKKWEAIIFEYLGEKLKNFGSINRPKKEQEKSRGERSKQQKSSFDFEFKLNNSGKEMFKLDNKDKNNNDKKIWFECVACGENKRKYFEKLEPINLNDRSRSFLESKEEISKSIHGNKDYKDFRLAYYDVIERKEKQAKKCLEQGTVKEDDFKILCVNGYMNEKNNYSLVSSFYKSLDIEFIEFEGKKIYSNIRNSRRDIGQLCSVLFGVVEEKIIKEDIVLFKPNPVFLDTKTGAFSRIEEKNYLKCDFFCRDDFPFNGILFSTISSSDACKEFMLNDGEKLKKITVSDDLFYLQNPCKQSCECIFERAGITTINCERFFDIYIDIDNIT